MNRPRTILLAGEGARAVVHELLADGSIHVRVLTRDETFAAVMRKLRADVEEGDLDDSAAIRKAMKGAYGVVAAPQTVDEGRNVLKVAAGSEIEAIVVIADGNRATLAEYAATLGSPATFVDPDGAGGIPSMFNAQTEEKKPCRASSLLFCP